MWRILATLNLVLLPVLLLGQDQTVLDLPTADNVQICGAGFATLTASSEINSNSLQFEWWQDGQFLGALTGSNGSSQFITGFLITDQSYTVRVRLGNMVSPFTSISVNVVNEASILQRPEIELCGSVTLDALTEIDSIESYQWQILVPNEQGESFFQNLNSDSSDSSSLITQVSGFYRIIVTDSSGCRGISNEIEVTNERVFGFPRSRFICYDRTVPGSDELKLVSDGRSFTEYLWEKSLDSINFTFVDTTKSINVRKPTFQLFDSAFYRLTVTEQNCTHDTTIVVYWRPNPQGNIRHFDPTIGQDNFFYCGDDPINNRNLQFLSSAGIEARWRSLNYSDVLPLESIKSFDGPEGPLNLSRADPSANKLRIGEGDEIFLTQNEIDISQLTGGLVYAIMEDTLTGCQAFTNAIFADTAFPFPLFRNSLAYDYPGLNDFIPSCVGDELVFNSYDTTADDYTWLEYDLPSDSYMEVGSESQFILRIDENFESGTYFLEVTKNGCRGRSEGFNVRSFAAPTAEIMTFGQDELIACNEIPSILLTSDVSDDVNRYQWRYGLDEENFMNAPGDSASQFYRATFNGYYKLVVSNENCTIETDPIFVEIPEVSDPDFVLVEIEGSSEYCEGEDILLTCNYQSNTAFYLWFYAFFDLDNSEVELFEIGETSDPEIIVSADSFDIDSNPLDVFFYIIVVDENCIVGSTDIPFIASISPNPQIEIAFTEDEPTNETFICDVGSINREVQVNSLSGDILGLTYVWTRYDPLKDQLDTIPEINGTSYKITEPGRYQAIAVSGNGICSSPSNSLEIFTLPNELDGDTAFCSGDEISLEVVQGFIPELERYSFDWFHSSDGDSFDQVAGASESVLTIDESSEQYGEGYYYYQASFESCIAISDTINISQNVSPTVEIDLEDDAIVACDEIPNILLRGEVSDDVISYQWKFSEDEVNFFNAPGDSSKQFYRASISGFYKLEVTNTFCETETNQIFVDIPESSGSDFVEVAIEGDRQYCLGEEMLLECNYESNTARYQWFYAFSDLENDESELFEIGETTNPEITLSSNLFGVVSSAVNIYFYILVEDENCVVGSPDIPFVVSVGPSPAVELVFSDGASANETFICDVGSINREVEVNDLTSLPGITYIWTRYDPLTDALDTISDASGSSFNITEPGRYQVTAITVDGLCSVVSNSLELFTLPNQIDGDTDFCFGNDISVEVVQGFLPDLDRYSFDWFFSQDGQNFDQVSDASEPVITIDDTSEIYGDGFYYYQVSFDTCMVISDTLAIVENVNSFNSSLLPISSQQRGQAFEAVVELDSDSEANFIWEPTDFLVFSEANRAVFNIPEDFVDDIVTIQVTISSIDGCEVLEEQDIQLTETVSISFPKLVSPNGDNINDTFYINGVDTEVENKLVIFDTWGNRLFSYDNYYNQSIESETLLESLDQEGVYYYLFTMDREVRKGSFYFTR